MGGLGNQLFQIATAFAFARQHGMDLVLPKSWQDKPDRKPIWTTYFKRGHGFTLLDKHLIDHGVMIYENSFSYRPLPRILGSSNYRLHGYFQSSKYFNDYKDEIRALLQVPTEDLAASDINNMDDQIGAHVRRGDYLCAAAYHLVTSRAYFRRARAEIEKRVGPKRVCWITEPVDESWVRENVYEDGDIIQATETVKDFACLSQFRHIIMSNSSYSWWAAWLNPNNYVDRVICCPDKWFGPTGPQDYETVYEPEWVRIDTTSE